MALSALADRAIIVRGDYVVSSIAVAVGFEAVTLGLLLLVCWFLK